ncbi:shematrin-like protein 1 [Ornithodoros turicata]|uniref:shematrin-like protein 1 n=1 Tax=Ornithodoros turicata TaxID=34597 RepID=UPI00313904EA
MAHTAVIKVVIVLAALVAACESKKARHARQVADLLLGGMGQGHVVSSHVQSQQSHSKTVSASGGSSPGFTVGVSHGVPLTGGLTEFHHSFAGGAPHYAFGGGGGSYGLGYGQHGTYGVGGFSGQGFGHVNVLHGPPTHSAHFGGALGAFGHLGTYGADHVQSAAVEHHHHSSTAQAHSQIAHQALSQAEAVQQAQLQAAHASTSLLRKAMVHHTAAQQAQAAAESAKNRLLQASATRQALLQYSTLGAHPAGYHGAYGTGGFSNLYGASGLHGSGFYGTGFGSANLHGQWHGGHGYHGFGPLYGAHDVHHATNLYGSYGLNQGATFPGSMSFHAGLHGHPGVAHQFGGVSVYPSTYGHTGVYGHGSTGFTSFPTSHGLVLPGHTFGAGYGNFGTGGAYNLGGVQHGQAVSQVKHCTSVHAVHNIHGGQPQFLPGLGAVNAGMLGVGYHPGSALYGALQPGHLSGGYHQGGHLYGGSYGGGGGHVYGGGLVLPQTSHQLFSAGQPFGSHVSFDHGYGLGSGLNGVHHSFVGNNHLPFGLGQTYQTFHG